MLQLSCPGLEHMLLRMFAMCAVCLMLIFIDCDVYSDSSVVTCYCTGSVVNPGYIAMLAELFRPSPQTYDTSYCVSFMCITDMRFILQIQTSVPGHEPSKNGD